MFGLERTELWVLTWKFLKEILAWIDVRRDDVRIRRRVIRLWRNATKTEKTCRLLAQLLNDFLKYLAQSEEEISYHEITVIVFQTNLKRCLLLVWWNYVLIILHGSLSILFFSVIPTNIQEQLTFSPLTPTFTPSMSPDVDSFGAKFFIGGYWNLSQVCIVQLYSQWHSIEKLI